MREIKYRGRREDDSEWIYGSYQADVMGNGFHTIMYSDSEGYYCEETVYPETVGEYTGLKDKNGREIYEGDIVQFCDFAYDRTGGNRGDSIVKGSITFEKTLWLVKENNESGGHLLIDAHVNDEEIEIIGNIFNDPMLLEGDNKDDSQR